MDSIFITSVKQLGSFSTHELSQLWSRVQSLSFKQDELLLQPEQTCSWLYYISRGTLHHYHLNEHGDMSTLNLFLPGDWVLDHQSFTLQQPTLNHIQACEDSDILALGLSDLHELIAWSPAYFRLGTVLESSRHNPYQQPPLESPEDRYLKLMDARPQLLQQFPLKLIASYLGITPETLSRVRRKITAQTR